MEQKEAGPHPVNDKFRATPGEIERSDRKPREDNQRTQPANNRNRPEIEGPFKEGDDFVSQDVNEQTQITLSATSHQPDGVDSLLGEFQEDRLQFAIILLFVLLQFLLSIDKHKLSIVYNANPAAQLFGDGKTVGRHEDRNPLL